MAAIIPLNCRKEAKDRIADCLLASGYTIEGRTVFKGPPIAERTEAVSVLRYHITNGRKVVIATFYDRPIGRKITENKSDWCCIYLAARRTCFSLLFRHTNGDLKLLEKLEGKLLEEMKGFIERPE